MCIRDRYGAVFQDYPQLSLSVAENVLGRPYKYEDEETVVSADVYKRQDNGLLFTIATGRSLSSITHFINGFGISCPLIISNGARIVAVSYTHLSLSFISSTRRNTLQPAPPFFLKIPYQISNTSFYEKQDNF